MTPVLPQKQPEPIWPVLAGVRFLLASIVLTAHVTTNVAAPAWAISIASLGGFAAVVGFLLISGFSIAHSLDRGATGFYERRFWRLAPVYLACLALAQVPFLLYGTLFQTPMHDFEAPNMVSFLLNALCLQTWFTAPGSTFAPSWSLAVEVAFYLAAPLLAQCSERILIGMIAVSAVAYSVHNAVGGVNYFAELHGVSVLCLAWAWIGGFLFYRIRNQSAAAPWLIAGSVCLVAYNRFAADGTSAVLTLAAVTMALSQGSRLRLPPTSVRALEWMGDVSYPLYLVHLPILIVCAKQGIRALPSLLLCYAAAVIVFCAVDIPAKTYRRSRLAIHRKRVTLDSGDFRTRQDAVPHIEIG